MTRLRRLTVVGIAMLASATFRTQDTRDCESRSTAGVIEFAS
jgi:hypothetical protein